MTRRVETSPRSATRVLRACQVSVTGVRHDSSAARASVTAPDRRARSAKRKKREKSVGPRAASPREAVRRRAASPERAVPITYSNVRPFATHQESITTARLATPLRRRRRPPRLPPRLPPGERVPNGPPRVHRRLVSNAPVLERSRPPAAARAPARSTPRRRRWRRRRPTPASRGSPRPRGGTSGARSVRRPFAQPRRCRRRERRRSRRSARA